MMNSEVKNAFTAFANVAAPYLHIVDEEHYEEALQLIEELLEEVSNNPDDPKHTLIDMLSKSIGDYEDKDEELAKFEKKALQGPADLAMLRLIIDQHQLKLSDFPEIGDKTLLSKILKGERNLTKQHIIALSKRFGISPGLFF